MRKPFKKTIAEIAIEGAHGGSGRRQLILSPADPVSSSLGAMTKGFLDAGGVFDWHDHADIDEFFTVLAGKGQVFFKDGSQIDYSVGDVVYMPANLAHRIEAQGETTSEFFFIRVAA